MSTKEQSRKLITLARQGKLEGEQGLRPVLNEAVKMQLDLDYKEKPYFRSALWEATWKNNEAIVKLLADKGASVAFADYQGRTPLHEAAYYGHYGLVEFFLDRGHPIDVVDNFGQTPLFRAVEGGRHEVVELLVRRKASTNLLDRDDVTPQHLAAFGGLPTMSTWLVYKGSWRNRFAIDEGTKQQREQSAGTEKPLEGAEPLGELEEAEATAGAGPGLDRTADRAALESPAA